MRANLRLEPIMLEVPRLIDRPWGIIARARLEAVLCQRLLHPPGQLGGTLLNPLPSFNPPALHNPSVLLNPSALLTTPAHAAGGQRIARWRRRDSACWRRRRRRHRGGGGIVAATAHDCGMDCGADCSMAAWLRQRTLRAEAGVAAGRSDARARRRGRGCK